MRYRLDSTLPLRAFAPRSGRTRGFAAGGMTLEGGSDSGAPSQSWFENAPGAAPEAAPAEPQGSVTVSAAPADSGGGGGGSAPVDQATLNQLYQTYLGRAPDAGGSQTWAGQDLNSVIAGITGSQEYSNRGGGNPAPSSGSDGSSADLTSLYQTYLGRAPDQSGAQTYAGWSTQDVTNAILGSQEYAQSHGGDTTGGANQNPQDLNALYQQYLGRNVDTSGAQTWAGQSPDAIIAGITGSQEYQNLHPGAEPVTGPSGDPTTWEKVVTGTDPSNPDIAYSYYKDPKTGNLYSTNDENAKLVVSGTALSDKNIQTLGLKPEEAQQLYDLKKSDPTKYYGEVASQIGTQIYDAYRTNGNYDQLYNQLQSLKEVAPQEYYKTQLDFLAKQAGWQTGQNTGDRAAPVMEEIKKLAADAQGAGVKFDDVKNIVNTGFSTANVQNQQRIAELGAMGGTGFNFAKDLQPGLVMVAMAAAAAASGGAALAIGEAALGVGAAGAATLGGAVVGAGMGALNAAAYNGNIGQGAIKGAIGGGIGGAGAEISTASGLVGTEVINSISASTGLTVQNVSGIISNTVATAIAAAATGQINRTNFASTIATALASSSIGAYAGQVAKSLDPTMTTAAINAVSNVAKIATTATLNGNSIQKAVLANIPSIVNSAVGTEIDETRRQNASQPTTPFGTENVGLTSGAVDRTLNQGLVDPYINQADDPIQAYAAQRNLTGNPLDNIRYSTNVMLDQNMPKQDIVSNLAAVYNVDEKTAENYYQNTLANNTFERLAAKSEDPIALLNAAKMLTGDKQENLKYIADEMKNQGLSKSQISTNLQDLYQIPKDQAEVYANRMLGNKGLVSTADNYSDAFKEARAAGAKAFEWNGKQYTTQLAPPPSAKPAEEQKTPMQTLAQAMAPRTRSFEDAVNFAKDTAPLFDNTVKGLGDRLTDPNRAYPETFKKYADTTWQKLNTAIGPYLPTEVPTLENVKSSIPTFDSVQQSFMKFVDNQFAPGQPSILDATKDITDTLVDVAKIAPRLAQSTIINAGGDALQSFSGIFLSPFGRENIVYAAGKAMSNFAQSTLPDEVKTQINDVHQMVKDAPIGSKELTAIYAYMKNPWAFGYLAGTEAVQDLGILGAAKTVGLVAEVSGAFQAYKASVAADLTLNFLESYGAGVGSTYDKLKAKGVDHDTAVTTSVISGTLQGITTMVTQGIVDAALLKRLSSNIADLTGTGITKIGIGAYSGTYGYTYANNLIEQKAVNPDRPLDFNQANTLAAEAAPLGAASAINTVVLSNFQAAQNETNAQPQQNVPLLKGPESETQSVEAQKLLSGPQAAPKLLPAPDQIAEIRDIQNKISQTIQATGIAPDMANAMAIQTIGSDLVSKINDNISTTENKLDPNKVLGTDADGNPITFADVFGSLATDEPILETKTSSETDARHNETLAKDIKVKLHDLLGIDLGENALVAQTQRVTETQTTEGLPFKERPSIENLFAAFDLTAPETQTETETKTDLKTLTAPTTQTLTSSATQTEPVTQTKTQLQTVNPTAVDIALANATLPQPITQTQTLMEPVSPRPTPQDIALMDPSKLSAIITQNSKSVTPKVTTPVAPVSPPDVTTTNITPITPANPKAPATKLPVIPVATSTKKKKLINPPDLLADFAKGRKIALPLEQLMKLINTQPSNVIPMENYQNPNPIPFNLEDRLKAAKEGGLMRLAAGGGTGGSSAGSTPGSNISIGPGDAAYSPIANFIKGSETKSYLPEKYDLQMFTYAPTPYNADAALKAILGAAEGGIVHMASGGESENPAFDPGSSEVKMKGNKFAFHRPFVGLNMMSNAPKFNDGGEVEGHNPQFFSEGGLNAMENRYVTGDGDGTSDSIPAMLANGEFVIPADVVSSLGNGSNDSGASILDEFLKTIRDHKTQTGKKGLPPDSKGALGYLLEAKRKARA
jgi:hypothetical protein